MIILMSTWTVLKDLVRKSCLIKNVFYSPVKDRTTGDNGKKLDGQIKDEIYLTCKKIGMNLT